MKILAIGDFHGKFPVKLKRMVKKEDPELIISLGDYCGNDKLGKLFFRYVYGTDMELWEFIGKKETKKLERENYLAGIEILRKLESFNKKVILEMGSKRYRFNWKRCSFFA